MNQEDDTTTDIFRLLKQQRDELKLQIHLGGKDAQDQWTELETVWQEFQKSVDPLSQAVKDAACSAEEQASKVGTAASEVAPQILTGGYEKLRKLLE